DEEESEESFEYFTSDAERVRLYDEYIVAWRQWAENLRTKKKAAQLYNEFFDLVSRFEREGETIELVYGRGILTWNHSDEKIGIIRSPIVTSKLELNLDAKKGVITASRVEETNQIERE